MDIGTKMDQLSNDEESLLELSFKRSLEDTRVEDTEVLVEKFREYWEEIMVAARIAKYELNGSFDGQAPEAGNFGLTLIQPGYFGYDEWDNMPDLTGCSAFDWIDDDTPDNLSSGASGFANPITIGDPVVHVVLGFGSYSPDPVVTRIKEEKNDTPKPTVTTEEQFRNTDLRIKWKDTPTVLQPEDTYAARGYAGGETGSSYEDAIRPVGLTFIEARKSRLLDPADMAGTDNSDVVVET
jgi:hypothetical protein